jgi:hypothetical protein
MNEHPQLTESQKQLVRLQAQVDTLQAEKQAWVEDKPLIETPIVTKR